MGLLNTLIESAFPFVLDLAQGLADSAVDGAELNPDQKKALWNGYNIIKTHGMDLSESTGNTYDDDTLAELAEFCKDTLEEAGITVAVIPDFG